MVMGCEAAAQKRRGRDVGMMVVGRDDEANGCSGADRSRGSTSVFFSDGVVATEAIGWRW